MFDRRALALTFATLLGCATVDRSRPGPGASLLEAAELAHHCSGESPYDDERAAFLKRCIEDNLARARALLAAGEGRTFEARHLAAVRLFVEPELTEVQRRELCSVLGTEELADSQLDDEARAGTCAH